MNIENLLRNKSAENIETIFSLSLLKKTKTLLIMLMLENHIKQFLKNIQNKLNVINRNINHTVEAVKFYAAATKKKNTLQIGFKHSTTSITFYNNEQQKKQLNESQKKNDRDQN